MNAPDACNEGFVRDDAVLVVVIITDEEDDHEVDSCEQLPWPGSSGEPGQWYQDLVAHKGGVETNIVRLSPIGPADAPSACPALDKCEGGVTGAEMSPRLVEVTQMFTHGFVGRLCEPNDDTFFGEAVSVIETACDDFEPAG